MEDMQYAMSLHRRRAKELAKLGTRIELTEARRRARGSRRERDRSREHQPTYLLPEQQRKTTDMN
jgi:hypothetical protein